MVPTISSESPISLAALSTSPTECSIWIGIFLKRYFDLGFRTFYDGKMCTFWNLRLLVGAHFVSIFVKGQIHFGDPVLPIYIHITKISTICLFFRRRSLLGDSVRFLWNGRFDLSKSFANWTIRPQTFEWWVVELFT